MRKRLLTAIGLLVAAAALAGCAQLQNLVKPVYFETVQPGPSGVAATIPPADLAGKIKTAPRKAVLLPFADYSSDVSPATHIEYHGFLQDALVKALQARGMEPVIYGGAVNDTLFRQGVVLKAAPILQAESPRTAVLFREIEEGEWSPVMSRKMGRIGHHNLIAPNSLQGKVDSSALHREAVRDIGAAFEADYVIRGRITVYHSGLKWGTYPLPEEVLAFYFPKQGKSMPLIGLSNVGAFEWFEDGPSAPPPASIRSEDNQPFTKDTKRFAPLVRLDLFIQEAAGGDVVYAESAETLVSQVYSMSRPRHSDELYQYLERAIPKAVALLVKGLD